MIPDDAVEAAVIAMQALDVREGKGEYPNHEYTADAKAILEAAAPYMECHRPHWTKAPQDPTGW